MKKFYVLFLLMSIVSYTASAQLIINEVLYDPPADLIGDANGDGIRDATEDEFIEFINNSATSLDVSDYKIYDVVLVDDTRTLRHTIATGTVLPANGFLVIFGGGTPTGTFGGATVIADTGSAGLSMNNSGERIEVEDAVGNIILTFNTDALSNNPDESYTRDPDITGAFVQHAGVTAAAGALFSPGTLVDGSTLSIESFNNLELSICPNPVSQGQVTIKTSLSGDKYVTLYDINGRKVLEQITTTDTLNVSGIRQGLYILEVRVDNHTNTSKLIIK